MSQQTCQSCGRAFQEVLTFQERQSPSRDTEETGQGADAFVTFSEKYRCLENTLGQFLLLSIFMAGNSVLSEFFKI